jgi:hypothetical protein
VNIPRKRKKILRHSIFVNNVPKEKKGYPANRLCECSAEEKKCSTKEKYYAKENNTASVLKLVFLALDFISMFK